MLTPSPSLSAGTSVLAMRDGYVELGGRPVLRGVDLVVSQGEVVAILGANGSGKSTLVRALLGLAPLRQGQVELFGTPVDRFRDWRRVGFVPQRTSATAGVPASVREVVSTGRLAHRGPLRRAGKADRQAVRDAIGAVGLADRIDDSVATLSGGQQQRVLIARALTGAPDVLVLDEPTAGVDLTHQDALAAVIAGLVHAGTTIALVAHEMGPLEPLIARTLVMRDGRLAYDGSPLADHAVHSPGFGEAHAHHHHPDPARRDHRPAVSSPFEERWD
jgi:zinc transport system ATP-binding protein